jgi:hypothetical protein
MDLQEGMVTFLGRLANRGSLCLLPVQMRTRSKGCTLVALQYEKSEFFFPPEPNAQDSVRRVGREGSISRICGIIAAPD